MVLSSTVHSANYCLINCKISVDIRNVLNVLSFSDPPKFAPPPSSTAVGVEGEPLTVAMMAAGNPMSIAYTWTKDGLPILPNGNGKFTIIIFNFLSLDVITLPNQGRPHFKLIM